MAEAMSELDKRKVVDPLAAALGVTENYRVTERPNKGVYEGRPVVNTDKWADSYLKVLHAEEGTEVTVVVDPKLWADGRETVTLKGLGQEGANALHFNHEVGTAARQRQIQLINNGELKAPQKNWDKNFGPEGGVPLDELKFKYPDLYNTKPPKKAKEEAPVLQDEDLLAGDASSEGQAAEGLTEPLDDEDLDALDAELRAEAEREAAAQQ